MMQGDQYGLPISLYRKDGSSLTSSDIRELEIMIGDVRKLLSRGEISFDEGKQEFIVRLEQKDTFRLKGDEDVKARVKLPAGDVVGISLGKIDVTESRSKVVL